MYRPIKDLSKVYSQECDLIKYVGLETHEVEGEAFTYRVHVLTFDSLIMIE